MPQLVKGGKFVFGWSRVGAGGMVTLPPAAVRKFPALPVFPPVQRAR